MLPVPLKKLRILVADDHPILHEVARFFIEREPDCEVCATAANAREAVEQTATHRPDVVLLDLRMPGAHGLEVARRIKSRNPEVEIVAYSAEWRGYLMEELFEAGIRSFVPKSESPESLISAIRAAAEHRTYSTPDAGMVMHRQQGRTLSGQPLTRREREVIRLIGMGQGNKDIGAMLGISRRTAEVHRARIMRKLGVTSTAELIRYAIGIGLIKA